MVSSQLKEVVIIHQDSNLSSQLQNTAFLGGNTKARSYRSWVSALPALAVRKTIPDQVIVDNVNFNPSLFFGFPPSTLISAFPKDAAQVLELKKTKSGRLVSVIPLTDRRNVVRELTGDLGTNGKVVIFEETGKRGQIIEKAVTTAGWPESNLRVFSGSHNGLSQACLYTHQTPVCAVITSSPVAYDALTRDTPYYATDLQTREWSVPRSQTTNEIIVPQAVLFEWGRWTELEQVMSSLAVSWLNSEKFQKYIN